MLLVLLQSLSENKNESEDDLMAVFCRSEYNYDADKVSRENDFKTSGKVRTQQNQKDEADINTIVRRFGVTGQLPTNVVAPQYGDFTAVTDYQSALNAINSANLAFLAMPPEIRKRFDHDPAQFVEFCCDPKNKEEMKKLGLVILKTSDEKPSGSAASGSDETPK